MVSCKKTDEIKVTPSVLSIPNDGSTVSLNITSTASWEAVQDGNYDFTLSEKKGEAGTTEVKVKASGANLSDAVRRSTITFMAGEASASVTCTQDIATFSFSPESLELGNMDGDRAVVSVSSNTSWTISAPSLPMWIKEISPLSGTGDGQVVVVANENKNKKDDNNYVLKFAFASAFRSLVVHQKPAENNPPTAPGIVYPSDGQTDVSIVPIFRWTKSTDKDVDEIFYTVYYSKDDVNWSTLGPVKDIDNVALTTSLENNTVYRYFIEANDGYNAGKVNSDTVSFTTGSKRAYADGEYALVHKSAKEHPFTIIITGDGYVAEDYEEGGAFDQSVNKTIAALFDIEPYKSYKEYFDIYKLAAISKERGMSNEAEGTTVNTVFSSKWEGGYSTGIDGNKDKVVEYAKKIPGVTDASLRNSAIAVLINADIYAGTCWSWTTGESIAFVPNQTSSTQFDNTFRHEFGGHGIGRLADEYQYYYKDEQPSEYESRRNTLIAWHKYGYYLNISEENEIKKTPWADLYGLEKYYYVSIFEGGYLFYDGFWRSEDISCMWDNRKYFNAISRWLIVDRILSVADEESTLDKFIAKDVYEPAGNTKAAPDRSKILWNDHHIIER